MSDPRTALATILRDRASTLADRTVVAGFDGFVDELIEVVDERQDLDTYQALPTIARFSEVLGQAAGRSSLREIVVRSQDAGGCAVNLGDGIARLGAPLHVFATLGNPRHAAFDDFAATCASVTSWGASLAVRWHSSSKMANTCCRQSANWVTSTRRCWMRCLPTALSLTPARRPIW